MPERYIGNITYKVHRSFCGQKTSADLIKARMAAASKDPKNSLPNSPAVSHKSSGNTSDPKRKEDTT